jgi:hypothetical protein
MPQQPAIGADVTSLMPPVGADVSSMMGDAPAAPAPPAPQQQDAALISQADWDALPMSEKMQRFGKTALNMIGGTFLMQSPEATKHMGENPGTTLAGFAAGPVLKHAPGLVARGLGISGQRAGENLQAATQAAKGVPVNVEKVGQEGLRAIDLQATGARMPRAATTFMRRITDPTKGDLPFEEGRDFYSNLSRLSANEYGSLNPTMARQITSMRKALHDALVESAETVGKGSQYAGGVREYARAARAAETGKKVAKVGAGVAGAGLAGNYILESVLSALGRTGGTR